MGIFMLLSHPLISLVRMWLFMFSFRTDLLVSIAKIFVSIQFELVLTSIRIRLAVIR
jgi:hypothetical protein